MGFSTIVATGISVLILLVVGYFLLMGFSGSIDNMTATMKDVESMKGDQMKTSIAIYNVSTDGHNVTFEMDNNGYTKIINFSKMDVIITFNQTIVDQYSSWVQKTDWFPYQESLTESENAWTCTNITPDLIDPRVWNPGEKVYGRMYVQDDLVPGSLGWVVVTAPNGATGMGYFRVKI
jgi:flagellar protein FlaF